MTKTIPQAKREQVQNRDGWLCCRCGVPTRHGQWHHRRGRRVKDQHTHCSCNGVWLCDPCHDWVHDHPFEARNQGFIVTRHEAHPGAICVTAAQHGTVLLTCDGNVVRREET